MVSRSNLIRTVTTVVMLVPGFWMTSVALARSGTMQVDPLVSQSLNDVLNVVVAFAVPALARLIVKRLNEQKSELQQVQVSTQEIEALKAENEKRKAENAKHDVEVFTLMQNYKAMTDERDANVKELNATREKLKVTEAENVQLAIQNQKYSAMLADIEKRLHEAEVKIAAMDTIEQLVTKVTAALTESINGLAVRLTTGEHSKVVLES